MLNGLIARGRSEDLATPIFRDIRKHIVRRPDVQTSGRPDVRTSGRLDVQTSGRPDIRTLRRPDVRFGTSERPDVRTSGFPDVRRPTSSGLLLASSFHRRTSSGVLHESCEEQRIIVLSGFSALKLVPRVGHAFIRFTTRDFAQALEMTRDLGS